MMSSTLSAGDSFMPVITVFAAQRRCQLHIAGPLYSVMTAENS